MHDIPKQIPLANNHISVDCVVIGFDGEQLKVLLINRIGEENGKVYRDMKLPGSLTIWMRTWTKQPSGSYSN